MLDLADIMGRIDELLDENKGPDAEILMKESIVQAVREEDDNALLTLLNELIGYYRETSQAQASFQLADQARILLSKMGLEGTIPYATTMLNIANAYRAGGRLQDSEQCFGQTMEIYRRLLAPDDMLAASLYNNMSLLSQEMGNFAQAKERLLRALDIVKQHPEAYFELAVTYANLAATCLRRNEDEEAAGYFKEAIAIFEAHGIEEAHYSAALASLATYYYKKGEFGMAAENFRKAMDCVRRSLGENEHYHRLEENLKLCEDALSRDDVKSHEDAQSRDDVKSHEEHCQVEAGGAVKGLALCREYYETYGKPMIRQKFPEYADQIAAGLVGEGSDCFGYDDELSRDHDWGPDFCLWVTEEVYEKIGQSLTEAFEQLPKECKGYRRTVSSRGQGRRGVQTINGFYGRFLGTGDWEEIGKGLNADAWHSLDWPNISDASLAAVCNGAVFEDEAGVFSALRQMVQKGYPEDIQYLKLAESAARISQTGQYNYGRMLERKDQATAQIMLGDWMREVMKLCYFLENTYPPHDKWLFKGLETLGGCGDVRELLEEVAESTFSTKNESKNAQTEKIKQIIEETAGILAHKLYEKNFISDTDPYLDAHTEELLKKASLARKSNEELVEEIAKLEFRTFDKVCNVGGRADCQDDWSTFSIMRESQYSTWDRVMLLQYLYDFHREVSYGHNLITEKYGRMMESTAPEEYAEIKDHFEELSPEKKAIVEAIVRLQVGWMEEFEAKYPTLAGNARSVHTAEDNLYNTSYETYLRGELSTYSDKMLELYGRYVVRCAQNGGNLACEIMLNSVRMYGYQSLEEAEKQMILGNQK